MSCQCNNQPVITLWQLDTTAPRPFHQCQCKNQNSTLIIPIYLQYLANVITSQLSAVMRWFYLECFVNALNPNRLHGRVLLGPTCFLHRQSSFVHSLQQWEVWNTSQEMNYNTITEHTNLTFTTITRKRKQIEIITEGRICHFFWVDL